MPHSSLLLAGLFFLAALLPCGATQPRRSLQVAVYGDLMVNDQQVSWPTPASLAQDLRSKDDRVRLRALHLLGMEDEQLYVQQWSATTPSRPLEKRLLLPDVVSLTYAALGEDATQQAVLAIQSNQQSMVFAAVAEPGPHGWLRIAAIDCGCRYDPTLAEFLTLSAWPENPVQPSHLELVLRTSGGGSGLYVQHETRFRVHQGQLTPLISFERRHRDCNVSAARYCVVTQRTFEDRLLPLSSAGSSYEPVGTLTTVAARIPSPQLHGTAADWQLHGHSARCQSYRWNEPASRFERSDPVLGSCQSTPR